MGYYLDTINTISKGVLYFINVQLHHVVIFYFPRNMFDKKFIVNMLPLLFI
jgi:hypothetical protein